MQESWFMGDESKHHENKKVLCRQKYIFALTKHVGHKSSGLGGRLIVVVSS